MCRSSERILNISDYIECGWTEGSGVYEPKWTSVPKISESCQDLTSCKCVSGG